MHTVRNRVASKPRHKGKTPRRGSRKKSEPAFMLKLGNPPAFPPGLIVPPPRGAAITAISWPQVPAVKPAVSSKTANRRKAGMAKPSKSKTSPVPVVQPLQRNAPAPMMTEDLLDRALAMRPIPAEETVVVVPPIMRPTAIAAPVGTIPRGQALAPVRGHGLFDIIGHWLRDAGNWLIRLDGGRRKNEHRQRNARTNARLRALQSQYDALEALREVAKAE